MKKDVSIIPEKPTNNEIMEAFYAMTHTVCNLSAIWGNANANQWSAIENEAYPFDEDFESVMHNMINWAEETKNILEKK